MKTYCSQLIIYIKKVDYVKVIKQQSPALSIGVFSIIFLPACDIVSNGKIKRLIPLIVEILYL
jgi:mitochondrial fission protein ELM1